MSPTWKAALGILLVFILGWAGGILTTLVVLRHKTMALMQRGPEAIAIVVERQTTRNLNLNADQKAHMHELIVQNIRQRMELQKQIQPQVRTLNQQSMQQIDALLTPDQQQKFHDNLVLFKSRFGRNPFNVGPEEKPAQAEAVGATPGAPSTNTSTSPK